MPDKQAENSASAREAAGRPFTQGPEGTGNQQQPTLAMQDRTAEGDSEAAKALGTPAIDDIAGKLAAAGIATGQFGLGSGRKRNGTGTGDREQTPEIPNGG